MWLRIQIFLAIFIATVKCEYELRVCVKNLGCVVGIEMPGFSGGDHFEAFLGVPYAKPPIGELRFRNPEPVESWSEDLLVKEAKPDCKQRNAFLPDWPNMGDEDCLYMNIYRPKVDLQIPLPVLFYIHGGGFVVGSSNPAEIGPEYFMETQEVILVVISYRLGPFGFLSSGCSELPGNFGLKDQLLALKWVNAHIAEFDGDPKKVTLFGHGAGASSVHFHMLNPKTKGLFKRGILSSGNALSPFIGILDEPLKQLHQMAQDLGIKSTNNQTTRELVNKLRTLDGNEILQSGDIFKFWHNHNLFHFRPVVENSSDINAYLTEHPEQTITKGNYELRPWLTSIASYRGEGAVISLNIYDNHGLRTELNQNFDDKLMQLLDIKSVENLNRFIDEYMRGIHELNENTRDGFMELFTDYYFYYPLYRTLKYYLGYADVAKYPAYIYKFSYHGPYTYAPIYAGGPTNEYDAVHLDDFLHQFRQAALFPDFAKDSIDYDLTKKIVNILLAFVKSGQPLHYSDIGSCTKSQFSLAGPRSMCKYLEFINSNDSYKLQANNYYHIARMQLWDEVDSLKIV